MSVESVRKSVSEVVAGSILRNLRLPLGIGRDSVIGWTREDGVSLKLSVMVHTVFTFPSFVFSLHFHSSLNTFSCLSILSHLYAK